ncbi:MAG: FapA family protein [Candidatus Xenobia bacterium]
MRRHGISVVSTMLLVALATVVAFAVASLAFYHTTLEFHHHGNQLARQAARSAIAATIYNLKASDGVFGSGVPSPTPLPGLLQLAPAPGLSWPAAKTTQDQQTVLWYGPEGSTGIVTFNHTFTWPPSSSTLVAWSTHNFSEGLTSAPVPAYAPGEEVPPNAIDLVATGMCGSEVRRLDVLVYFPPFPYALQTGDNLDLESSTVGALNAGKADVASNSGVTLKGGKVSGNARAVGAVTLTEGAQVGGAVEPEASPVPLPAIDPSGFDPETSTGQNPYTVDLPATVASIPPAALPSPTPNFFRASGPTLTVNGDVNLNHGLLYVQGDLHVTGAVTGYGAIVATGNVTIDRGANLSATDQAALIAGGNVTLQGPDQSKQFRGVVYCGGTFQASDITLLGAFASQQAATVTGTQVVYDPQATRVSIDAALDFVENVNHPFGVNVPEILIVPPGTESWVSPPVALGGQYQQTETNNDIIEAQNPGGSMVYAMHFQRVDKNLAYLGVQNWQSGSTQAVIDDIQGELDFGSYLNKHELIARLRALLPPNLPSGTASSHVVIDPNRFLSPGDRMRILEWRDL